MLVLFVLGASAGVVAFTVVADAGRQIWSEKQAEKTATKVKELEAVAILRYAIAKRFQTVYEAKVVQLPKKQTGGRHRLVA